MTTDSTSADEAARRDGSRLSEGLGAGAEASKPTARQRFDELGGGEEPDPVERLRFFCSLAMSGQDWLDVEPFFDDVLAERGSA